MVQPNNFARRLLTSAVYLVGTSVFAACQARSPDVVPLDGIGSYGGIVRPITRERLVNGSFLAYSGLWEVTVPGGDPVRFHPDGRVENRRAGLAGSWTILDDSTVTIGNQLFRHRIESGDLFAPMRPVPRDSALPRGTNVVGTRIIAAPRPGRIGGQGDKRTPGIPSAVPLAVR